MKFFQWAFLLQLLLLISTPSYGDTTIGKIVDIVGQRVTITNEKGQALTFTIPQADQLTLGEKIKIEYTQVGDASLASSVTKITQ
jgi:hypothetical protein